MFCCAICDWCKLIFGSTQSQTHHHCGYVHKMEENRFEVYKCASSVNEIRAFKQPADSWIDWLSVTASWEDTGRSISCYIPQCSLQMTPLPFTPLAYWWLSSIHYLNSHSISSLFIFWPLTYQIKQVKEFVLYLKNQSYSPHLVVRVRRLSGDTADPV